LMISVGRPGVTGCGSAPETEALRSQFERQHYLRLPGFLQPEILDLIQGYVDRGEFFERVHNGIGSNRELCMEGNAAFGALLLCVNDETLFQVIQAVTQCPPVRCFEGRVYRVRAGRWHHDSWHSDLGDDRLIGMSINLGKAPYAGGVLQIRERDSIQIVAEIPNTTPGDAVIFRLSDRLQHRITEIEGEVAKTAFAGWFKSQPDFIAMLRDQGRRGAAAKRAIQTPAY
jgi:2-oxoglutarate-Fe(II)-dependent oxygenase superfamily protein